MFDDVDTSLGNYASGFIRVVFPIRNVSWPDVPFQMGQLHRGKIQCFTYRLKIGLDGLISYEKICQRPTIVVKVKTAIST